jgi:hypothetical protein
LFSIEILAGINQPIEIIDIKNHQTVLIKSVCYVFFVSPTIHFIFHNIHFNKEIFQTADLIKQDRVVFNIKGNHYRLIAAVDFKFNVVYIKWFGKHKDYDKIEPSEVKHEYPPC